MFNNIQLYRYDKTGTTELERIVVPLSYADKEKFYARITQDPTVNRAIQVTLPRMSFEMSSINYDPLRKTSTFNDMYSSSNGVSGIKRTPYDFQFTLSIYVRNTEDGTQIVEQILPYFSPDYTLTIDLAGLDGLHNDVPIILDSINYNQNYTGEADEMRVLTWDLTFTVKAYLYGPTATDLGLIRQSTANIFNTLSSTTNDKTLTVANTGSGKYTAGELVYEGKGPLTSNGTGFVTSWNNVTNQLALTNIRGTFKPGFKAHGALSNAVYTIASVNDPNQKLVNIDVTTNPNNATLNTAFGFDTQIDEYPTIV